MKQRMVVSASNILGGQFIEIFLEWHIRNIFDDFIINNRDRSTKNNQKQTDKTIDLYL